jgi:hypothetical protein
VPLLRRRVPTRPRRIQTPERHRSGLLLLITLSTLNGSRNITQAFTGLPGGVTGHRPRRWKQHRAQGAVPVVDQPAARQQPQLVCKPGLDAVQAECRDTGGRTLPPPGQEPSRNPANHAANCHEPGRGADIQPGALSRLNRLCEFEDLLRQLRKLRRGSVSGPAG